MLTQLLIKIFVATPKRQVVPEPMKDKLVFIFVKEKFIWGVKEEWVTRTQKVRISDLEKTIIDALAHPQTEFVNSFIKTKLIFTEKRAYNFFY